MQGLGRLIGATIAVGLVALLPSAASPVRGSATPVKSGCPPSRARLGSLPATVDQVIGAARSKVTGQVTHNQGRTERRTRINTPVSAVVMEVAAPGFSTLPNASGLFRRARRRCGRKAARLSDAVIFHDGLSLFPDASITRFVVRGESAWWVFGA
jgi:hypothetical protein